MKKGLAIIAIGIVAVAGYFIFSGTKEEAPAEQAEQQQPLHQTKNSDSFNTAFAELLTAYFSLKESLINWDSTGAITTAQLIKEKTGKIDFKALQADSGIIQTAVDLAGSIEAEAAGLAGENSIEQIRRSFQVLSENLYNLIRVVRYDGQVIYHDKCPMAFTKDGNDEIAYWLSDKREVANPYLGNKHPKYKSGMLHCGEVEDSLSFGMK